MKSFSSIFLMMFRDTIELPERRLREPHAAVNHLTEVKDTLRTKGPDPQNSDRDMQELMTLALRGVRPTREPLFGPRDEL